MPCEHMGVLLSRYVDGEASAEDRRVVEGHVHECADCRKELEVFKRNEGLLAQAFSQEVAGEAFVADVLAKAGLARHPKEKLLDLTFAELTAIKGIGHAKAAVLMAGFELAKRALNRGIGILPTIAKPSDALPLVADLREKRKEHFVALLLNARNQVLRREDVSVGSLNASLVHPREVFGPAVGTSAAAVILVHNHPSGDVAPSREDLDLTDRMVKAGQIMGVEVLDHLIVAKQEFLSFRERGLC